MGRAENTCTSTLIDELSADTHVNIIVDSNSHPRYNKHLHIFDILAEET